MRPAGLIYVLTGERGSGKSTVCARVARDAVGRGLVVAGILTERSDAADFGSARRVVDLRSGEGRSFGAQDTSRPNDATSDPLTPGWGFEAGVFAWANEALARSTPCDLLVVDEIGPLELLGGRGWAKALDVLSGAEYRAALVVCRPGLLKELQRQVGGAQYVLDVTTATRDALPGRILDELADDRRSSGERPETVENRLEPRAG